MVVFQESEAILERMKSKQMDNLIELHNKTPVWNDGKISGVGLDEKPTGSKQQHVIVFTELK